MSFVYVIPITGGGSARYIAESEIVSIDNEARKITTRDGERFKIAEQAAGDRLLARSIVIGVTVAVGTIISVPVSSVDHVIDVYDEIKSEYVGVATTRGGVRFVVSALSRAMSGLDDDVFFDCDELRKHAARIRGEKVEDDPAIEAAAERATSTEKPVKDAIEW